MCLTEVGRMSPGVREITVSQSLQVGEPIGTKYSLGEVFDLWLFDGSPICIYDDVACCPDMERP
jgi:hypothetical protein